MKAEQRFWTLPEQVANTIREGITSGLWNSWLPPERQLTSSLGVSRKTIRYSLEILRNEGHIKTVAHKGHQIYHLNKERSSNNETVGMFLPLPFEELRPHTVLWIEGVRKHLYQIGLTLETHEGQGFYSNASEKYLQRIVSLSSHTCWLLPYSTKSMQAWFHQTKTPCIVVGSVHQGFELPFVDTDLRAVCKHAVGILAAKGHRSIAYIVDGRNRAGDVASIEGFNEGINECGGQHMTGIVEKFYPDGADLSTVFDRLIEKTHQLTAMIVSSPYQFTTIMTHAMRRGIRIPQDISFISRDDDYFLRFLKPRPAYYSFSPYTRARYIVQAIRTLHNHESRSLGIIGVPEFVSGNTVGMLES